MKNQKWILLSVALVLMAGTAFTLTWFRTHQKLGAPGIIAEKIPGSVMMKINLPERVLDFSSTNMPEPQTVLNYLPPDTSYAERIYFAPDGFQAQGTIILMGGDRTSIHKPEYCLPGQGWTINEKSVVNLPVAGWQNSQMPVAKWIVGNSFQSPDGRRQDVRGIYVFGLSRTASRRRTITSGCGGWDAICCAPAFCSAGLISRILRPASPDRRTRRLNG